MSDNSIAALLLTKQFKELQKNPVEGFSAGLRKGNPFEWDILVMGPPDTIFEGGYFKAELIFSNEYPNNPPTMKFLSDMWHPNIYSDGKVCISILHPPGEDEWGYEKASERWLPIHTVETILISVISMLASPNCESPANIDASVDFKDDYKLFKKKVMRTVRKSQEQFF
ncbi:ubiquitin-conjugating enzyme e2 7-like [Anaeramoeba flamelloides]|uniref:E2 ubiquitin-conjugating enzyme n=1 Tax=Anaeramoeba flamelloides TaxID=1746091 RepID=A0AAV7Z0X3_9EUKA|nr:ubiquitin-conjugating enzyme e2 7-like [Anaeramoeba flamelloides]